MTLNGRVARLEATYGPPAGPDTCRVCGLRHVRPVTLALIRGVLRVAGGSDGDVDGRPTLLCLCACCTTDPGDRWFARLSHGLSPEEGAA